jgi:hypothetical protein
LTHFKLYARDGVPDGLILDVLHALRIARLEVLVLDGIAQGSLVIIDHIAGDFPNLLGLTLIGREDEHQHANKLATWPHLSWEYASSFSTFKRLRHFAWNFRINTLGGSPHGTVREDGSLGPTPSLKSTYNVGGNSLVQDYPHTENSCDHILLPFAIHCTTLRTFVIVCRSGFPEVRQISRGSGGAIVVERSASLSARNSWNIDEWNPFHWALGWPSIIHPVSDGGRHNSSPESDTGIQLI